MEENMNLDQMDMEEMDEEMLKDYSVIVGKENVDKDACPDDYAAPGELTVTITLHEYRDLLKKIGDAEARAMQQARWRAEDKIEMLEEKIKELKDTIASMMEKKEEQA